MNKANIIPISLYKKPIPLTNTELCNLGSDKVLTSEDKTLAAEVRRALTNHIKSRYMESGQGSDLSAMPAEYFALVDLIPDFAIIEASKALQDEECDLATVGEIALRGTLPALCDAMNVVCPEQYSHSY